MGQDARVQTWGRFISFAALVVGSGCYTYAFHERTAGPTLDRDAVDTHEPTSTVQWSYLWGALESEWAPDGCEDDLSSCSIPVCDGLGAGRVETTVTWYSLLLALVTIGTVVPVETTIYCSTQAVASEGP